MALAAIALLWASGAVAAVGLELDVRLHYPSKGSAADLCGFRFQVSTGLTQLTPAQLRGPDLFGATIKLPDSYLYTSTTVAVMADFDRDTIVNPNCTAVCPNLAPQGQVVQSGPYLRTDSLAPHTAIDVWPAFCRFAGDWESFTVSFDSSAIGRQAHIVTRIPGAFLENPLPRPGRALPPVVFRFNSEWFWPHPEEEYTVWHSLMINGAMEPVAVAEVYFEGLNHTSWANQPIFSKQKPSSTCGACDPELQFICDNWQGRGYDLYKDGDHSFGNAEGFFDELYGTAVPQIVKALPAALDGHEPRLGVWGYCIGGLAAWNALTLRPGRFSIAYLGSPAMDFDCGAPFQMIDNLTWPGAKPKVYIDTGGAEGDLMLRQSRLLFTRLQERGLADGHDIFFERAPFGTHQARQLLRRALKGLLVLFGSGDAAVQTYVPAVQQVMVSDVPTDSSFLEELDEEVSPLAGSVILPGAALLAFTLAVFVAGRMSVRRQGSVPSQLPLLA